MAIRTDVYKISRIVPVRFMRAGTGNPDIVKPDMDDRGYTGTDHGPIVGVVQGDTVTIRIKRENVENAAQLFVTSSDTAKFTVTAGAAGRLPATQDMDVQLTGVRGGNPVTAKLEVRFGSITGPIIGELGVWVYSLLDVDVCPHLVTIRQGAAGPSVGTAVNINNVMNLVRAIWRPCGVTISVSAVQNETLNFAQAGIVSNNPFPGELRTLLGHNWQADHINVYIVNQIGAGQTLGYGFSRASFAGLGLPNPGIVLAESHAGGSRAADTAWLANDLAHEIGHFFGLWHPENQQPPDELEDTWSRRMLMHNFNLMRGHNPWPAYQNPAALTGRYKFRPLRDDVGYGNARRGCLVTHKNLTQRVTDGESTIARATIASGAGPY